MNVVEAASLAEDFARLPLSEVARRILGFGADDSGGAPEAAGGEVEE